MRQIFNPSLPMDPFSPRLEQLMQILQEEPPYRKKQILKALFQGQEQRYSQISSLPKTLRNTITQKLNDSMLTLAPLQEEQSQQATKWLFQLIDNHRIETVQMTFQSGLHSLCISSQVGCSCACSFCATGKIGFKRHLSADEIVDQVLFFIKRKSLLDSISFMGMGEPLLNPHIFDALTILTNKNFMGLSPRRFSISTVGIPKKINELSERFPQIPITFSLHSPFDSERNRLVPFNQKYPLKEVFEALEFHIEKTNKETYIAYIVFPGENDTMAHVKKIKALLERKNLKQLFHLKLLPFHPSIEELSSYDLSKINKAIVMLKKRLEKEGIKVTIRQSFGTTIGAACGQLLAKYSVS